MSNLQAPARSGLLAPMLSATLLLFTLGVAIPATIYLSNAGDFSITPGDLFAVSSICLVLALFVLYWPLRYLRVLQRVRPTALIFALAALVWLQGNVLVWQYGPLDGRSIDWDAFRPYGFLDASIWIAALAVAWAWPRPIARASAGIGAALILLQLAALGVAVARAPAIGDAGSISSIRIDESRKFEFPSGRNAILIVLDESQSDVFAEIVREDPAYREVFDGFTYFPDAVAGANFTELAIPALLTGQLYDNSVPKSEFMRQAYVEYSLPAILMRAGFRVDVFPWVGWGNESMYFDEAVADNFIRAQSVAQDDSPWLTEKKVKELIHLLDLSLFRAAPHFLKPFVYNEQRWLLVGWISRLIPADVKQQVSNDRQWETMVFAEAAQAAIRVRGNGDAFRYYHLKGAHSPLMVTPDLRVGDSPLPFSRANYVLQLKASLLGLAKFFAGLEAQGVFDRSLIVIVGDHGSGYTEALYVATVPGTQPRSRIEPAPRLRNFARDKARAMPLVLIKRPHEGGTMRVSQAPVSVRDLPATMLEALGIDPVAGVSMFADVERSARTRQYGAFDFLENRADYLGPIVLYDVIGPVQNDASWVIADVWSPPDR